MRAVARDPSVQLAPSASAVCPDLFTHQVWAPAQLAAVTKKSRARLLIWYSLLEHYPFLLYVFCEDLVPGTWRQLLLPYKYSFEYLYGPKTHV